jgi:hypothetical protein
MVSGGKHVKCIQIKATGGGMLCGSVEIESAKARVARLRIRSEPL